MRSTTKFVFAALAALLLGSAGWMLIRPSSSEPQSGGNPSPAATESVATRPPTTQPPLDPVAERLTAFDSHLRAGELESAEADLRSAIELAPGDPRGHRTLAQLLNAQGRRYEASQHVRELARSGVITPHELLSLVDLSGPFQLVSFREVIGEMPGTLFDLGKARHQYVADEDPAAALKTLDPLAAKFPDQVAVQALRGCLIAEQGDQDQFAAWLSEVPDGIDQHPEYWLAIGTRLSQNDRDEQAVRALGESLRLDPTSRRALRAMTAALSRLGKSAEAVQVQKTLATLDQVYRVATSNDPRQTAWIAEQLQTLTRLWESVAWYRQAFAQQGMIVSRTDELNLRARQIRDWEQEVGTERIRDARLAKMLGFDLEAFPLPDPAEDSGAPSTIVETDQKDVLRFTDIAPSIGLDTTFISDYPIDRVDFYLYQANGGGLAVIDYDLDGRCDLYVAQSGGDPNQTGSSQPNQLFRQLPGEVIDEVTTWSGTDDRGYAQGVCAGDVNQDGLPDLLIANIGTNVLYINQGDGTFREASQQIANNTAGWTSSIALGDLDGDQLPEIVEVNYLDDPLIYERKCHDRMLECTPQRFRAASDRIFRSSGDGTYEPWQEVTEIAELPNYGFGVVIANFDGQHGNDLFISNDGDLNHFWKSLPAEDASQSNTYSLTECAGISGCSIGNSGVSQACMGIASGDFDRNGLLDLLVTNFHNEPVNLFLLNKSGFFVDEALQYRLAQSSKNMLGFGTQATDFDNDGWLDVAILNGHIYDARYADIPFQMEPQLMIGGPRGFALQEPDRAGAYWQRKQLARTLALLDWNRDGRMDMVANHLDQPVAVLENESVVGDWLQLELVGVGSERDAIGAVVTVDAGGEAWTLWQTGGDGYMCSNENLLHVGLGEGASIDKVTIAWPSGTRQEFGSLKPNRRYLMIEGQAEPWAR